MSFCVSPQHTADQAAVETVVSPDEQGGSVSQQSHGNQKIAEILDEEYGIQRLR